MTNPSWGVKRTCTGCGAHFYDLNKLPATCPKCQHEFAPAVAVRAKRKTVRRDAPESKKDALVPTVLAQKKQPARRKDPKDAEDAGEEGGIGDIAEIEDVDDIENLRDLSELEEREEPVVSGDDADDEAIIDALDAGDKAIVGNIEEEEASVLDGEIEEEDGESDTGNMKPKKKRR